ncbi:hypothetical protein RYD26_05310 [Pasteurellaceae bacterium LIM206]|nr:hypothetical protein [Pasteurellaceae bacterium LIM206]
MTILQTYFDNKLVEAGFPGGLKIEYSLSYCQGDGMAFYGDIDFDHLPILFAKIYPDSENLKLFEEIKNEIMVAEDYYPTCKIAPNTLRYCHFNTMDLYLDYADNFALFDQDDEKTAEIWETLSCTKEQAAEIWNRFVDDLIDYIVETSKNLADLGYRLIESTYIESDATIKTFDTKSYRVEFKIEPIQFYANWCAEEFGYEDINELCNAALSGTKFVDLTAIVYQKKLGIKMGESSLGYCSYNGNDKSYAGNKRYLIHEAISEARTFVQLASKAAQHLRSIVIN